MACNTFLFSNTRQSEAHTSGWHAIHGISEKLELKKPDNFKATSNRHRVSTLYSALDLPKAECELLYKHIGHSVGINENTYQAPPACCTRNYKTWEAAAKA